MPVQVKINPVQVKINKTFYNSSIIYFEGLAGMPDKCKINFGYKFSDQKKENRKKYSATKNNNLYKMSCGKGFVSGLGNKLFSATKAAWYLSSNSNLDIGEYLNFDLSEENGEYSMTPNVKKPCYELPDNAVVPIDGCDYTAAQLRKIAQTFIPEHAGWRLIKGNNKKRILWDNPTNWINYQPNSTAVAQSYKVYNAVYMWIGSRKQEPNKKYLYIGIVGAETNISNSVGNRMLQHQREKGITIEQFRYSELVNWGNYDRAEILQTVEMQCINNFSALFPVWSKDENIIRPIFSSAHMNGTLYEIELANSKVRYQQGYPKNLKK